jgi:hypothetical protein
MNQETQTPGENQNPAFTRKSIETPILDSSLRKQINSLPPEEPGFKGFYKSNKIYFWAIILGLVVILVLGFFAFRKTPVSAPKEANISITTSVPENVPSGGEAVYSITVKNNDSQKLIGVLLELSYPDGMTYESSLPKADNLSGTIFPVPDLIPGQNAALFIKARANGNVNDQKTLNIKLHYRYVNFNSEFVKDSSVSVRLIASNVIVELKGPDSTNNAQLVVYELKYQNNSDDDIKNARIKIHFPDGFTFASASPQPDLSTDTWNVGALAKNASSTISVQGNFTGARPGESKTTTADFLILGSDGNYFTQNSATVTTAISSLPLLVTQEVSPSNNSVVNPGDVLNFTVTYQNNGTTAAQGVNVQVDLDSKAIDASTIRAEGGQINNNSIVWNASGVPKLASLNPSQGGQLTFSVKVNNPASKDSTKNLTVVSDLQIKANEYTTPFPGNKLTLKISSPTSIGSDLTFVSGSLPPQVGKSTTYKVTLSLKNSSNDFAGGSLTAFIPLGSGGFEQGSVNSAESQNVQYDASTGKLTWNFAGLLANTGRFTASKTLSFNVTLNPASSQANQPVTLVKDINMQATDVFTQAPVKASLKNITTTDIQGQSGFSNGTVQP